MEEKIRLALEKGSIVISDRFDASTIAYQIFGRRRAQYLKVFEVLNKIAKAGLEPDAVIYLDVNPRVGLERNAKAKTAFVLALTKRRKISIGASGKDMWLNVQEQLGKRRVLFRFGTLFRQVNFRKRK